MADLTQTPRPSARDLWDRAPKAWIASALILAALALFDPAQLWPTASFALQALLQTAPYIAFAVLAVAWLKATGAEALLAKAFTGQQTHMIVMAALLGGLSPFCSCQVIPFIAALLALGVPLAPVMAFWLASPLMDPAMFSITAGTLGFEFAIAKTAAAVGLGLMGGLVTMALARSPVFADPLRPKKTCGSCCSAKSPFEDKPVWRFWGESARRETFRENAVENGLFLIKWLLLAYLLESLMLSYVPAEAIASVVGGEGVAPVLIAALVGAPAYLNGYAAVPLVDALIAQGMTQGAAMAFVIAGGVSCIPAAVAVWALVKPRVFAAYLGFAFVGAVLAGFAWEAFA
ncbi:permease [Vannielia litorea]|uniref:permease n=1 Tax=Vannielia litorea TaxID=1217970 RepID=UPI001BCB6075|nr:permease [Vannielia litorea]MBS8226239.1 permease [Vannielia litorea]